ncbi:MAG: periplasmic solute-binding protein [bacterium]|nr:MAG: periplasmic solute-binding protein [bacterium]
MSTTKTGTARLIRIGHSPDPDDAFMFYALSTGRVIVEGCTIEHRLEDIESLNRRALNGEYEMTAFSAHAYPEVAHRYQVMRTGASMGRGYGPIILARKPMTLADLAGCRVAIPGLKTTAWLLLQIFAPTVVPVVVPFDRIMDEVEAGRVDAGLVIHEGQLTWTAGALHKVADFGTIWDEATGGLPLPLGLDAVRRDLGPELIAKLAVGLSESIRYAYEHEAEAMEYARGFGRGIEPELNRKFVRMYVSDDTIDMGDAGIRALETLYDMAVAKGLLAARPPLDMIATP